MHLKHRSLIAWLVVIALGLHSLIPAGYMPDFSSPGLLVLCDGTDHQHHHAGGKGHDHRDVCPFSAGAFHGFAALTTPIIAPPEYAPAAIIFATSEALAREAGFANASPRSPPFFS